MTGPDATKASKEEERRRGKGRSKDPSRQAALPGPQEDVLSLQREAGNWAVGQLLRSGTAGSGIIQPVLMISQPEDQYEQEADLMAEQVMRMPNPKIQRQPEEGEAIQKRPLSERITPLVQRQVKEEDEIIQTKEIRSQTHEVTPDFESSINVIGGNGEPLPGSVRSFFEHCFTYDFSKVRVHWHAQAAEVARTINARACTVGRDIVFGTGQYAPESREGQRLLAHELTHVIQHQSLTLAPARSTHQGVVGIVACKKYGKLKSKKETSTFGKWKTEEGAGILLKYYRDELERLGFRFWPQAYTDEGWQYVDWDNIENMEIDKVRFHILPSHLDAKKLGYGIAQVYGPTVKVANIIAYCKQKIDELQSEKKEKKKSMRYSEWVKETGEGYEFAQFRMEMETEGFLIQPVVEVDGSREEVDWNWLTTIDPLIDKVGFRIYPPLEMVRAGFKIEVCMYSKTDLLKCVKEKFEELKEYPQRKEDLKRGLKEAKKIMHEKEEAKVTVCIIEKLLEGALHNDALDDYLTEDEVDQYCNVPVGQEAHKIEPRHYTRAAYEALLKAETPEEFRILLKERTDRIRKAHEALKKHARGYAETRALELSKNYFKERVANKQHILSCALEEKEKKGPLEWIINQMQKFKEELW